MKLYWEQNLFRVNCLFRRARSTAEHFRTTFNKQWLPVEPNEVVGDWPVPVYSHFRFCTGQVRNFSNCTLLILAF